MGAVGEDVNLRLRVLPDEGARRADGLTEPVGQVARLRVSDRRQRLLPVVAEGREHARLDGRLDDHDLGARPEAADHAERLALGAGEARGRDVRCLHRSGGVEDDDDALGAMPHHGDGGARQSQSEGDQHQQL
jgi:hypothetical protein